MEQDVHAVVQQQVVGVLADCALAQAVQVVEGHLFRAIAWVDLA